MSFLRSLLACLLLGAAWSADELGSKLIGPDGGTTTSNSTSTTFTVKATFNTDVTWAQNPGTVLLVTGGVGTLTPAGSWTGASSAAKEWTFTVTAPQDGLVTCTLPANSVMAAGSTTPNAVTGLTITVDTLPPRLSSLVQSGRATPWCAKTEQPVFALTLNDDVTLGDSSKITIERLDGVTSGSLGSVSRSIVGSSSSRTITVTGDLSDATRDETLRCTVAAGAFRDDAGNPNPNALSLDVPLLVSAPSLTVATIAGTLTTAQTVWFDVDLDKDCTLNTAALSTSSGVVGTPVPAGFNRHFAIPVNVGSLSASVTLTYGAGAATDRASNHSTSVTSSVLRVDSIAPTLVLHRSAFNSTSGTLELIASEPLTTTDPSAITLVNGQVDTVTVDSVSQAGGSVSRVAIAFSNLGIGATLDWSGALVADLAGNPAVEPTAPLALSIDVEPPQIAVSRSLPTVKAGEPKPVFTIATTNGDKLWLADPDKLTVSWSTTTAALTTLLTGQGTTRLDLPIVDTLNLPTDAVITCLVQAGSLTDAAGNPNPTDPSVTVAWLVEAPKLEAETPVPAKVHTAPTFRFTAKNKNRIALADATQITVTGGDRGLPTIDADGMTLLVPVTNPKIGPISATVLDGAVKDLEDNRNVFQADGLTVASVTYDNVVPTFAPGPGSAGSATTILLTSVVGNLTLSLSETATLDPEKFHGTANVTLGIPSLAGTLVTIPYSAFSGTSATLIIDTGAATDDFGNPSPATSFALRLDTTSPTMEFASGTIYSNQSEIILTVTASEEVTLGDGTFTGVQLVYDELLDKWVETDGMTVGTPTGGPIIWQVPVSFPSAAGTVTTVFGRVTVHAAKAVDRAGNPGSSDADRTCAVSYDTWKPLTYTAGSDSFAFLGSAGSVTALQIAFDELVQFRPGLTPSNIAGSITCQGATITGLTTLDNLVTVSLTSASSKVTVALGTNAIQDLAGNHALYYDPVTKITTTAASYSTWVSDAPTVTKVYSKDRGTRHYETGETIFVVVRFSKNVVVEDSGTPALTLQTNRANRKATLATRPSAPTNELTFRYVVQWDDYTSDLDYVGPGSLTTGGARIRISGGTDADLTLADPGKTGSLSQNYVDGVKDTAVIHDGKDPDKAVKPPLIDNGDTGAGCGSGSSIAVLLGGLALALRRRRQRR